MSDNPTQPPTPDDELKPIATIEEYREIMMRLDLLRPRAEEIANVLCPKRASFSRFDTESDMIVYEYNNACSCHPEDCTDSFPSEFLFDPQWEERYRAAQKAEQERREAAERKRLDENARKKERAERTQYERLRAKYEGEER